MPSYEEEALKRAQQMHSRVPLGHGGERSQPNGAQEIEKQRSDDGEKPKPEKPAESAGALEPLMRDKEQSLILLLLLLLYGESSDPALLLALMYLLI